MNDTYKEILVARQSQSTDLLKKGGMIFLTAVLALGGFFINPLLLVAAVVSAAATWFVITSLNVEYEYLYVNGDFDIDKIMNKQRRKRVASYTLETMEIIAPTGSHDLDAYEGKGTVRDYTSLDPTVKTYTAVYNDGGTILVRLELEPEIIQDLRRLAPRKVSRDCL